MAKIQWRPQVNALTTPQSYRAQVVPHNTAGYDEMAADLSVTHPNYNADLIRSLAPLIMEWIQQRMISGDQVTMEDAFTFHVSITGRLDGPDDPLPEDDDLLHVRVYPSPTLCSGSAPCGLAGRARSGASQSAGDISQVVLH